MSNASNKRRLEHGFNVAENDLGVTRLIEPDDLDVPKPDEKSIMTYIAQFYHKYPVPRSTQDSAHVSTTYLYRMYLTRVKEVDVYLERVKS